MPIALPSHSFAPLAGKQALDNRDARFKGLHFAALRSTGVAVTEVE